MCRAVVIVVVIVVAFVVLVVVVVDDAYCALYGADHKKRANAPLESARLSNTLHTHEIISYYPIF